MHWVHVERQRGPEPLRVGGHIKVRRGRSNHEPSPAELQDLFNTFGFVLTEEQGVPGSTVHSLGDRTFYRHLRDIGIDTQAEPRPTLVQDLTNHGAIVPFDGDHRATLYGLLCFGHSPQSFRHTGNHYVQCVAYAGTSRADEPVLVAEAKGCVDEQVRSAETWFAALGRKEHYVGLQRLDRDVLPLPVSREALVNAVAHRDYAIIGSKVLFEVFADRVVVTSPGELPNHLSTEAVLAGGMTRSRNQLVAHFLVTKRLMEQRGVGFVRMAKGLREAVGTELVLEEDRAARWLRVTLPLVVSG
ncbi:MAG: transcriptional regulator [Myxococcales bacterium]|nr:transcriptional regulator [Myxococcales bacterium]